MSKRVSILIVNWNGRHYLKRCLDSIDAQTYRDVEVVLVDNGSTDGSIAFLREHYPSVVVVESARNLGTAEGNNEAARHATGDYLFLFNNDAWFWEPDGLAKLIQTAERTPRAAIIGCYLLNADGSFQDAGEKIDMLGFPGGIDPPAHPVPSLIDDLFFVPSCAVLIRTSLFWDLGGYDERFFFVCEEVDLAWRARLRGYSVVTDAQVLVGHLGGGSLVGGAPGKGSRYRTTTTRIYLRERNTLAMLLKNYSVLSLARILPLYLSLNAVEVLFFLLTRKPSMAQQYLRAYAWNVRQLPATLRERRRVQRTRRVPDRDLTRYFWPGIQKLQAVRRWGIPLVET